MAAASIEKRVSSSPTQDLALTNCVFLEAREHKLLSSDGDIYVQVNGLIFTARADERVEPGCIAVNSVQRRLLSVTNGNVVIVEVFTPTGADVAGLSTASVEVDLVRQRARGAETIDCAQLAQEVLSRYAHQFLTVEQEFVVPWRDLNLLLRAKTLESISIGGDAEEKGSEVRRGMLASQTQLLFTKAPQASIQLVGQPEGVQRTNIFRGDWSFEKMGVGGLDQEFSDIFRRAFASRIFPVSVLRKLGISHVKGMLLFGPPGTGKTLIARQIGKMLNGKEPKVVHGPEILSKYVGQSEENIRALFADAEREMQERGDESELHIIIFDEIDSVCKQRGSTRDGTGVHDTVVNQLLSKIDGVHSLNNILVIGMTNRRDMIDEALLRPGRLEVQVEISLPDEKGRFQILSIHTAAMRQAKYLSPDVDLHELAALTKNFSGAEIEGLVKSAASFAFGRQVQADNIKQVSADKLQVTRVDFESALGEVRPAFGINSDDLHACVSGGVIPYGGALPQLQSSASSLITQLQNSARTSLLSVLFEGPQGSGTTALAAHTALQSGFPFVKLVSPNSMVGVGENTKAQMIARVFEDAHRSPLSVVMLDDLERLLDYVRIGPRFSNVVLQTLLTCIKRAPAKKSKVVILATTSNASVLESFELLDAFNVKLHVPSLGAESALRVLQHLGATNAAELQPILAGVGAGMPIKKLLLAAEMSMSAGHKIDPVLFTSTMQDVGLM